jgi:hypothetical protein
MIIGGDDFGSKKKAAMLLAPPPVSAPCRIEVASLAGLGGLSRLASAGFASVTPASYDSPDGHLTPPSDGEDEASKIRRRISPIVRSLFAIAFWRFF